MELKNYIQYYIGQKCLDSDLNKERWIDYDMLANLSHFDNIKPILRPLSDITEIEAEYFAWLCMDSRHHLDKDSRISIDEIQIELAKGDGGNMVDADVEIYIGVNCRCFEGGIVIRKDGSICAEREGEEENKQPVDDIAHKIHWLLQQGFDLFGLIDSNLAIDYSTVKK